MTDWLEIHSGHAPLLVAFPHTGIDLADLEGEFRSPWLARRDADWWVDRLYGFARDLGATTVRTSISRSVIDLNRDPSGASLYPGQATTELCPTTTFDGEALYIGEGPNAVEVMRRRERWFAPYHAAIAEELARLRGTHANVVLFDAHSIRSEIPRLFNGELPQFNIGTNGGATCDPELANMVHDVCAKSGCSHVIDGRFRGGWTTRHYGQPKNGIHAIQMELAIRGYADEPVEPTPTNWPTPYDADRAAPLAAILTEILKACIAFAQNDNTQED